MTIKIFIYFLSLLSTFQFPLEVNAQETGKEILNRDIKDLNDKIARIVKLYELPEGQEMMDITERLLNSPYVFDESKRAIISSGRHIYLFTYPSDGLKVKAFISFIPGVDSPVVMYQRGTKNSD